ncbi:MAG: hypothetical protein IJH78_00415 [Clostridia bacterium]|nr:hypothetical protein [Clostridia bacterium]
MRKGIFSIILLLVLLCGIASAEEFVDGSDIAGTYRYEGEGFGGDFTITLNADGTYAFYEGYLSSYMGGGTWNRDDDTVHMIEENGFDLRFTFEIRDGVLVYSAAGSDAFPCVDVSDGDRFLPDIG